MNRYTPDTPEMVEYQRNVGFIKLLLQRIIPKHLSESGEVAVAGSAALHWYQQQNGVGPTWSGVGDVDIFVCGHNGADPLTFKSFVEKIKHALTVTLHLSIKCKHHVNHYAIRNNAVHIYDITVYGIQLDLSFIQSPDRPSIQEVVADFDIDVCKVIWHITADRYSMSDIVREHITRCRANLQGWMFLEGGPGTFDRLRLAMTMKRIMKYKQRGFTFLNGQGISFDTDVAPVNIWYIPSV